MTAPTVDTPTSSEGTHGALEWIVARTIFPVMMGGGVWYAIAQIETGEDPAIAIGLPTIAAYFVIMGLERFFYWQKSWLHSQGDLKVDVGHLLVSGLLTTRALEIPARLVAIAGAAWLAEHVGNSLWPTDWNLWLQLGLALVFGFFFVFQELLLVPLPTGKLFQ